MIKKTALFIFSVFIGLVAHAQSTSADSVYSQYLDFNLARLQGEQDKVYILHQSEPLILNKVSHRF
jgi:hypothetical protein